MLKTLDTIFPKHIRDLDTIHWTPLEIAKKAALWLTAPPHSSVLDIGSGSGKFCIVGATYSSANFTGVEIRKNLVTEALLVAKKLNLERVNFINKDIIDVDFKNYNSFYYYNPFCEYTAIADKIDSSILFSEKQLKKYNNYVVNELKKMPKGTRLVTYRSPHFFPPASYFAVEILHENELIFWEKVK